MYSNIARSEEYMGRLLGFVRRAYGLDFSSILPAKRGFYGETWRLTAGDKRYFLKLDYSAAHQGIYERSFPVVEHLCAHGIDFISRVVKTADKKLSTRFEGAVLGLFDWIEGENVETDATKLPEYRMLAKVYTVPPDGIPIPREDFSGDSADAFFARWARLQDEKVAALLQEHRAKLEHRAARLARFSSLCRGDTSGFFITHGDAGGNLVVSGDEARIVDWDAPMLAPPERDAWVMGFRDWAGPLFERALRENGIIYAIRPERLAYYSYYTFFFYLNEYLDGTAQTETARELEGYFKTWVEERIEYADRLP